MLFIRSLDLFILHTSSLYLLVYFSSPFPLHSGNHWSTASMRPTSLDSTYKWNHAIFVFLWQIMSSRVIHIATGSQLGFYYDTNNPKEWWFCETQSEVGSPELVWRKYGFLGFRLLLSFLFFESSSADNFHLLPCFLEHKLMPTVEVGEGQRQVCQKKVHVVISLWAAFWQPQNTFLQLIGQTLVTRLYLASRQQVRQEDMVSWLVPCQHK
jgi:hypothetical protein